MGLLPGAARLVRLADMAVKSGSSMTPQGLHRPGRLLTDAAHRLLIDAKKENHAPPDIGRVTF